MDKHSEVPPWVIDREGIGRFTDLSRGDLNDHQEADRRASGNYIILF